jgi:thioredoxin reductase (NADPH)
MLYDVIVVGGSAAGLTAALYTARLRLKTLVITKNIGGQMLLANEIQNYPGVGRISGFELASKFKEQAELYGAEFIYEEAIGLEEDNECLGLCFRVKTTTEAYLATVVVLAFGKTPRNLAVPGERELRGKGVSYCAICDGPLFKGRKVAVIGTGDQALEAVLFLANIASIVYLVHNHNRPIGNEGLTKQALGLPNVKAISNSRVSELKGSSVLERVVVINTKTNEMSELEVDGAFVEVGYVSDTAWLRDLVKLDAQGQIEVDKAAKTSHLGIFAAGDLTDYPYRQVITSAGQGCGAALSAYNYIQSIRGNVAIRANWGAVRSWAETG